jgi:[ribosomal protein S5]-alanine N-acetyltransferase
VNARRSQEPPPIIHVDEFILRPLRPDDSGPWFGYLSDPRTIEHTSWPEVSAGTVTAIVDRLISEYETRTSLRWALAQKDSEELIGTCGFTHIDSADGVAQLAYDLAPAYWGNRVMRRAVEAVVNWAFRDMGLRRIEALVMVSNGRSIALLERCGFKREQLLPAHRVARGVPRDFWLYVRDGYTFPT